MFEALGAMARRKLTVFPAASWKVKLELVKRQLMKFGGAPPSKISRASTNSP
jgi:hypothetical protein